MLASVFMFQPSWQNITMGRRYAYYTSWAVEGLEIMMSMTYAFIIYIARDA